MSQIRLLADDVINKIAAGEVIERPASVVKELVDNAIDAGARSITIAVKDGGRELISVSDDGSGMGAEDAKLAFVRHATSKISSAEDLYQVASMGFRGEALASVAAVAEVTMLTKQKGAKKGTKVVSQAGGKLKISDWQGTEGTTITVADLFGSLPVRKNFLRAPQTEWAHVLELVQSLALCNPEVEFRLKHNDKEQLLVGAAKAASTESLGEVCLRQRAAAVVDSELVEKLIYVERHGKFAKVEALCSPPGLEKNNSKYVYTYVNGRPVKDKVLRFAVNRGYHSHLLKGRYPVVICFVTLDPSLVDVNVHPAKTEVRFQYAHDLQNEIAFAIRDAIRQGGWAAADAGVSPSAELFSPASVSEQSAKPFSAPTPGESLSWRKPGAFVAAKSKTTSFSVDAEPSMEAMDPPASEGVSREPIPWAELNYIGAYARCYLFFSHKDRLLVLDQHAFHERVLYERYCQDHTMLGRKQPLLVPEVVDMQPSQIAILREQEKAFAKLGFEYEVVGDQSVEVKAMPALLVKRDPQELFVALAKDIESDIPHETIEGVGQNILATLACHSAVRAGEELGEGELTKLLSEATTVDFYHNCPHGRRVFRWFSQSQVGSWFDR